MNAPYDAGLREPCRDCGSTGGYVHPRCRLPSRARGLCQACESRHSKQGTLSRYPLMTGNGLRHPSIPPGYISPADLGCQPGQHAVIDGYNADAVVAEAEWYAMDWAMRHPADGVAEFVAQGYRGVAV